MSLEATLEEMFRRVVREEFDRRMGGTSTALERELLTYEQAAALVSVSPTTIKRWVRSGALAAAGKGKLRRVRADDVRACFQGDARSEAVEPKATVTSILATVRR